MIQELPGPPPDPSEGQRDKVVVAKPPGRNAPQISQLHQLLLRLCGGRDVTALAGIGDYLL